MKRFLWPIFWAILFALALLYSGIAEDIRHREWSRWHQQAHQEMQK